MLEEKQKKSRQIRSFDLKIYPFLNEIVYLHAHDAGFDSWHTCVHGLQVKMIIDNTKDMTDSKVNWRCLRHDSNENINSISGFWSLFTINIQ